jgi:hypothetical protein
MAASKFKYQIESHKSHVAEIVDGRLAGVAKKSFEAFFVSAEGYRKFLGGASTREEAKGLCAADRAARLAREFLRASGDARK